MKKYKIIATLERGFEYSRFWGLALITSIMLGIVFVGILIVVIEEQDSIFFALLMFMVAPSLIGFVYCTVKLYKRNNSIKLYKNDAVEIYAKIKEISHRYVHEPNQLPHKVIKIKVTFKYNGKIIKMESGKKGGYSAGSYSIVYKKFIGKQIKILYSPKFNQVLFLGGNLWKGKNLKRL